MSLIWFPSADSWRPVPLAGAALAVSPVAVRPLASLDSSPACLRAVGGDWVLLAGRAAPVVNGAPLRGGIRVLRDRDELRFAAGERVFFSTERLAAVRPFEGASPICCPRCRQQITQGMPVVQCPACGAVSHQQQTAEASLLCWTYSATCPLCDQPTALDTGYRWTPEEL